MVIRYILQVRLILKNDYEKNIYLAVLLFLTGCQNELYKNPLDDFQSEQGVYIANGVLQSFVEEGKDVEIKGLQVALAVQDTKEIKLHWRLVIKLS